MRQQLHIVCVPDHRVGKDMRRFVTAGTRPRRRIFGWRISGRCVPRGFGRARHLRAHGGIAILRRAARHGDSRDEGTERAIRRCGRAVFHGNDVARPGAGRCLMCLAPGVSQGPATAGQLGDGCTPLGRSCSTESIMGEGGRLACDAWPVTCDWVRNAV
jgi:hypothetical protein